MPASGCRDRMGQDDDPQKALAAGFDLQTKPFDPMAISALIADRTA